MGRQQGGSLCRDLQVTARVTTQKRHDDTGRTTPSTFLSNCKILVILILHQSPTEKPRAWAARTPGRWVQQQKRPSPSKASAELLLLSRRLRGGCSGVPGRSQSERWGGHGGHIPSSRPARQAGGLRAQGQRGGAGACAEPPRRSLPRDGGLRAERMSAGTCPGSSAVVTGAISENPSGWYAAPHHNIQHRQ